MPGARVEPGHDDMTQETLSVGSHGDETASHFADGWHSIDALGALDCQLSTEPTLESIPQHCAGVFARSMSKVMQRIQEFHESENNVNLERSLKWLLFLPHALMRQPTRGGAAGRQIIAKRFNCIVEDNWSNLIDLFMRDREACQQKRERKENMYLSKKKSGDLTRKTNNAVSLISKGHTGCLKKNAP